MTAPTLHYRPSATVMDFLRSDARVRAIVGPWGSGKSSACAMEMLRRACEQKPGPDGRRRTRFAVIRNSYRELKDTTRRTFDEWLGHLGTWREVDAELHLSFADVRCEILFRSLDRPGDIRKLLSLELSGAYLNEARELAKAHLDALTGRVGRYPSMLHGGPSWRGVWMDSNPFHSTHWLQKLFASTPSFKLFRQPGGRTPEAENVKNLDPNYYNDLCVGKDQEWISVNVDGRDPTGAEGSVYGKLIAALGARGGLDSFEHPYDNCYSAWDIGYGDATSVWTYRINETTRLPDILDFFEGHGESFTYYAEVLESKPYNYLRHHFPWDAAPASWQSGRSHADLVMQRWPGKVATVPRSGVSDGIAAVRWLLERPGLRIHPRCHEGIELLRSYRYRYDSDAQVFSKEPVHDLASHASDAFRGLACVLNRNEIETRPTSAPPPHADLGPQPWRLDELFEDREDWLASTAYERRRI